MEIMIDDLLESDRFVRRIRKGVPYIISRIRVKRNHKRLPENITMVAFLRREKICRCHDGPVKSTFLRLDIITGNIHQCGVNMPLYGLDDTDEFIEWAFGYKLDRSLYDIFYILGTAEVREEKREWSWLLDNPNRMIGITDGDKCTLYYEDGYYW